LAWDYESQVVEIEWLEDFVTLVACRNFSRAAEERHVTQPAFSRRVRALESWLGVSLFEREHQPITLTEAGQHFHPVAQETLRRLFQAREEIRQVESAAISTLRFAVTSALSLTFFPSWLRKLEEKSGSFHTIGLNSDTLEACERRFAQGRAHFLLCQYHESAGSRFGTPNYCSIQVGRDALVPVTAPDRGGKPKFLLPGIPGKPLPLVAYSNESGLGQILKASSLSKDDVSWLEPVFTAAQSVVLKTMILGGRGVGWLPQSLIAEELKRGELVPAGAETWEIAMEIRLFRPCARQNCTVEKFWDLVSG